MQLGARESGSFLAKKMQATGSGMQNHHKVKGLEYHGRVTGVRLCRKGKLKNQKPTCNIMVIMDRPTEEYQRVSTWGHFLFFCPFYANKATDLLVDASHIQGGFSSVSVLSPCQSSTGTPITVLYSSARCFKLTYY